ncbi:hypothetical protein OROMI_014747 [Orobanche minor]
MEEPGSESDLLEEGLVHEQTGLLDSFLDETRIPLYFLKRRGVFDMGPSNLKQKLNTRPQTTEDHLTVDTANTLPNVATIDAGSKKRSRGPTTGKGLRKYFDSFGKIKINVYPSIGRPVNAVTPQIRSGILHAGSRQNYQVILV